MSWVKWVSTALGVLILLAVAAFTFLLGPAHWQIRSIDPGIPEVSNLMNDSWLNRDDGPIAVEYINTAQQSNGEVTIGHVAFLLTWASGERFLIDAGMNRVDAVEFGELMQTLFGSEATVTFGPVEEQMGAELSSISGVGFTHLHSDHTAGITAICAQMEVPATIYQTHFQASEQNLHTEAGKVLVGQSRCEKMDLGKAPIAPVNGYPGLIAIAAGGHTPGSTLFGARIKGKTWIFAGDITNNKNNMKDNIGKGIVYSYFIIPENTSLLRRWRAVLASIDSREDAEVVISHDIKAIERSAIPPFGN